MSEKEQIEVATSQDDLQDMIAASDTGARSPGGLSGKVLFFVPLAWAIFQLWIVSPLPFIFGVGIFISDEARSIHLAFAVFLAFTAYPTFKSSPRHYIPLQDWILSLVAAFCTGYIYLFYRSLPTGPACPPRPTSLSR